MSAHPVGQQVGTKLLFENDRVRVWEMVLQPNQESARHEHASDYVFVYVTSSCLAVIAEGSPPETTEHPAGFVQYMDVGSGIAHRVKNVGQSEHREVLVELKGPSRTMEPQAPQTNEPRREHVVRAVREMADAVRDARAPNARADFPEVERRVLERLGIEPAAYRRVIDSDPELTVLERAALQEGFTVTADPGPYDAISREAPTGRPGDLGVTASQNVRDGGPRGR